MTLSEDMEADPVPDPRIVNRRLTRFLGATQTCNLSELYTGSLEGLQWLYHWLEMVGEYNSVDLGQSDVLSEMQALVSRANLDCVIDYARAVRPAQEESMRHARILHDLRGAALHQLVGLVELSFAGNRVIRNLQAVATLARDHAKVLRHALIGLDEELRVLDSVRRLHGVANLRNRFEYLALYNDDGEVRIDFAAPWNGNFALSCSEFSTVLRQLYNLLGNAARHTADQTVLVRVYPKPSVEPRSVRVVVANALTSSERATMVPSVVATLWRGYTSTGSGLGLLTCAELVAEAFGVEGPEQAVEMGYVGSRITENGYIAWFHWPVVFDETARAT